MFLYFLPGESRQAIDREDLAGLGLGYLYDPDISIECVECDGPKIGTSLGRGLLIRPSRIGAGPLRIDDKQQWRWNAKEKKFAIGMGKRPTPKQLARKKQFGGELVKLRDGNQWLIPHACIRLGSCELPRVYDVDENGDYFETLDPAYEQLGDAALRYLDFYIGGSEISTAFVLDLAVSALQVNYRIGKIEAYGLLGLFGTEETNAVARATIDAKGVNDMLKKSVGSETPTSDSPESQDNSSTSPPGEPVD